MAKNKVPWEVMVTYIFIMHSEDDGVGPSEEDIYDQLEKDFPDVDRDCWDWEQSECLQIL